MVIDNSMEEGFFLSHTQDHSNLEQKFLSCGRVSHSETITRVRSHSTLLYEDVFLCKEIEPYTPMRERERERESKIGQNMKKSDWKGKIKHIEG